MHRFAFLGLALVGSLTGIVSPIVGEEPGDQRVRFLVLALENPISEISKADIGFPFLLDNLGALASPPGSEKDPSKRVAILCNVDAFKRKQPEFDLERVQIKFPSKLVGVRLETVLGIVCEQVDGTALVRSEFIEIVPRGLAEKELGLKLGDDQPMPVLVHRFFTKVPLERAFQEIAQRYNQNIVLAPAAEAKVVIPITARLVNVPLDAALETLADMAELKIVRNSNIFYVTTKEQADVLRADKAKKAAVDEKSAPGDKKTTPEKSEPKAAIPKNP